MQFVARNRQPRQMAEFRLLRKSGEASDGHHDGAPLPRNKNDINRFGLEAATGRAETMTSAMTSGPHHASSKRPSSRARVASAPTTLDPAVGSLDMRGLCRYCGGIKNTLSCDLRRCSSDYSLSQAALNRAGRRAFVSIRR